VPHRRRRNPLFKRGREGTVYTKRFDDVIAVSVFNSAYICPDAMTVFVSVAEKSLEAQYPSWLL
jgi:hypothetical protein